MIQFSTCKIIKNGITSCKTPSGGLDHCHINCYPAYALEMQIKKTLKSNQ